jgi:hypothetical protein
MVSAMAAELLRAYQIAGNGFLPEKGRRPIHIETTSDVI